MELVSSRQVIVISAWPEKENAQMFMNVEPFAYFDIISSHNRYSLPADGVETFFH